MRASKSSTIRTGRKRRGKGEREANLIIKNAEFGILLNKKLIATQIVTRVSSKRCEEKAVCTYITKKIK